MELKENVVYKVNVVNQDHLALLESEVNVDLQEHLGNQVSKVLKVSVVHLDQLDRQENVEHQDQQALMDNLEQLESKDLKVLLAQLVYQEREVEMERRENKGPKDQLALLG